MGIFQYLRRSWSVLPLLIRDLRARHIDRRRRVLASLLMAAADPRARQARPASWTRRLTPSVSHAGGFRRRGWMQETRARRTSGWQGRGGRCGGRSLRRCALQHGWLARPKLRERLAKSSQISGPLRAWRPRSGSSLTMARSSSPDMRAGSSAFLRARWPLRVTTRTARSMRALMEMGEGDDGALTKTRTGRLPSSF